MVVLQVSSLEELDRLKSANTYLVADFYADWCGPCHAIRPIYDSLATTHALPGHLVFVKVNVDTAVDVARRYAVTAMPTFLFLENGEPYNAGRSAIRGADPRSLQATVQELAGLARKKAADEKAAAAAKKKAEAEKNAKADDGTSVSGGYTLGASTGVRSDWKMSLRG
ncbi:Thioredoxin-like protein 2 [Colletotrichum chlorophyti]|uniref:Thioredoxin-like protein 2 n=1 Tax=Colletotrichum chlorophyti TaxID=708187 RepID=A0A1Q8RMG8_9PEZI|nr:Thioredoxin-like protein 2 [Colletotrichum chlorophyti]